MTKGHNNLGASGLHGFREKIFNEKTNGREQLSFDIPISDKRHKKTNVCCLICCLSVMTFVAL